MLKFIICGRDIVVERYEGIINAVPFAQQLGFHVISSEDIGALFELAPADRFIGNPMLRAFHGGIMCSLMECAMVASVMRAAELGSPPGLITQTTSFLGNTTVDLPLRVRTELTKSGKRIVGVSALAFQDANETPVAKCSTLYRAV